MSLIHVSQLSMICTNENLLSINLKERNIVNSYVHFIVDAFLSMCRSVGYFF